MMKMRTFRLIQRGVAFIYVLAFAVLLSEMKSVFCESGLRPISAFVLSHDFFSSPSVFHLFYSDAFGNLLAVTGLLLALICLTGMNERLPSGVNTSTWLILWVIYGSFVNVSQELHQARFEHFLLEIGFLLAWSGTLKQPPSRLVTFLIRVALFRLLFFAGLAKLHGDPCWLDLSCMKDFWWTQPTPTHLALDATRLPLWMQQAAVLFTLFVELVASLGLFGTYVVRVSAGTLILLLMAGISATSDLSWYGLLVSIVALIAFYEPRDHSRPPRISMDWIPLGAVAALNLYSIAGYAFPSTSIFKAPFKLSTQWGAFGKIAHARKEVILEGLDARGNWTPYYFTGMVGDPRVPPSNFGRSRTLLPLALELEFTSCDESSLFQSVGKKLLKKDPLMSEWFQQDPYRDGPPLAVRGRIYQYQLSTGDSSQVWERKYVRDCFELNSKEHRL